MAADDHEKSYNKLSKAQWDYIVATPAYKNIIKNKGWLFLVFLGFVAINIKIIEELSASLSLVIIGICLLIVIGLFSKKLEKTIGSNFATILLFLGFLGVFCCLFFLLWSYLHGGI